MKLNFAGIVLFAGLTAAPATFALPVPMGPSSIESGTAEVPQANTERKKKRKHKKQRKAASYRAVRSLGAQ